LIQFRLLNQFSFDCSFHIFCHRRKQKVVKLLIKGRLFENRMVVLRDMEEKKIKEEKHLNLKGRKTRNEFHHPLPNVLAGELYIRPSIQGVRY